MSSQRYGHPSYTIASACIAALYAALAATALPPLAFDGPRLANAGHGWLFWGDTRLEVAARHHEAFFAAHRFVLEPVFGTSSLSVVALVYATATVFLLGMSARRWFGTAGIAAPLVFALCPLTVLFGSLSMHEHAALFWLLVTWRAFDSTAKRITVPGAAALFGSALMAALCDYGSMLGVGLLAFVASWNGGPTRRSWTPLFCLVAAAFVSAPAAIPTGLHFTLYQTMDARFHFGFEHLSHAVSHAIRLVPVIGLVPLLGFLFLGGVRTLRGEPTSGLRPVVALSLIGLGETIVFREPGWYSNLAWWAAAAALASAALAAGVVRLASSRMPPTAAPIAAAVVAVLLATPGVLALRAVLEWPEPALYRVLEGEHAVRMMYGGSGILIAEGLAEGEQPVYLAPSVGCSLTCMARGPEKTWLDVSSADAEDLPSTGHLILTFGQANRYPALADLPRIQVPPFDVVDLSNPAPLRQAERVFRGPFERIERALGWPSDAAVTKPKPPLETR